MVMGRSLDPNVVKKSCYLIRLQAYYMLRQWTLVSLFQNDLSYYDFELWFVNSVRSLTLMDNK